MLEPAEHSIGFRPGSLQLLAAVRTRSASAFACPSNASASACACSIIVCASSSAARSTLANRCPIRSYAASASTPAGAAATIDEAGAAEVASSRALDVSRCSRSSPSSASTCCATWFR
jgi:hypothetical protein